MNKNISILLNIVLFIAVIVLYYLHFSSPATAEQTANASDSTATAKPIIQTPKDIKESRIVFINTDVLNENYDLVKELSSSIKYKQQALDSRYQKKGQEFQQKFMEYEQKVNGGLYSENQRLAVEEDLKKGKAELDEMEMQLEKLVDKMQADNEVVLKNVMDYIKEYNRNGNYNYILAYTPSAMSPVLLASDSLDITMEIVTGLNEQYKATKKK